MKPLGNRVERGAPRVREHEHVAPAGGEERGRLARRHEGALGQLLPAREQHSARRTVHWRASSLELPVHESIFSKVGLRNVAQRSVRSSRLMAQLFEGSLLLLQKRGQATKSFLEGCRLHQLAIASRSSLPEEDTALYGPARKVPQTTDEMLQLERVRNCTRQAFASNVSGQC